MAGVLLGTVTGFFSAIYSLVILDLSVLMSLLIYSGVGVATAILVIAAMLIRSHDEDQADHEDTSVKA
jgi:5-bromo-4-chloroindolyl phosphate hydrolysis protein